MISKWTPPCLCGCELQINADWLEGSVINGVSYQHPKAFTVTDVQIITICNQHSFVLGQPIDESVFMAKGKQVRGYLKYSIFNPTDAERLYSYLWRYSGSTHRPDTCSCTSYLYFDRFDSGNVVYKDHPVHSKLCEIHQGDKDHVQCIADNKQIGDIKAKLIISNPELHTPVYSEEDRNLVTAALLNGQELPQITPISYILNGSVTLEAAGQVKLSSPLLNDVASQQILSEVSISLSNKKLVG